MMRSFILSSFVSVFTLMSVSRWPVGSSSFGASKGQCLCANWLAVFLLSVSAGNDVLLSVCHGQEHHLVGGNLDCFTCSSSARTRFKLWKGVTFFNLKHMEWAWVSLIWVGFSDFYVRACHFGWWTDRYFTF